MKLVAVTLLGAGLGKVLESGPWKLGPTLASGQAWDALHDLKQETLKTLPVLGARILNLGVGRAMPSPKP